MAHPALFLFLTRDELIELTGYKSAALQCRWLAARGWVFERNAANRPIVGRAYANARLGCGGESDAPAQTIRPNFAALMRG